MTPERWAQIEDVYHRALRVQKSEQVAFLTQASADDEELRQEVERLLKQDQTAGSFLQEAAFEQAARDVAADTTTSWIGRRMQQRYEIHRELGRGGMGIVYEATDQETQEIVALKVLRPEIAADQQFIARFKNELKIARKITHKNVCRIYEFNRADDTAYISMERVDGESLRSVLNRFKSLTIRGAIHIAEQICSGLQEAHAQGVVHRDLKPENIMIDSKGDAKIMDFGLARSDLGITSTSAIMGTPAYMSPEQAAGTPVDARSDIYALGLILYEMLAGSPAFAGEAPLAVVLMQLQKVPAPPSQLEPTIPAIIERTIMRCIEKNPMHRFQTAEELSKSLRQNPAAGAESQSQSGKKSLIVLPFKDISPTRDNEYFCDGLSEEITSDLSQIHNLRVVSTTSAMRLKNSGKEIKTIGADLGVQYVLEGSVRRAKDDIRISTQLIDVINDETLWSEKYSGTLADVFDIQEQVSRNIVGTLRVRLSPEEDERIVRHTAFRRRVESARKTPDNEALGLLKGVRLFADFKSETLLKLSAALETSEVAEGEILFRQDDPAESMIMIRTGQIQVRKRDPETGIEFAVAQLGKGTAMGEMSLLTGRPRSATVVVIEAIQVYVLRRTHYETLAALYPEISVELDKVLAERLENDTRQTGIEYVSLLKRQFDPRIVGLLPKETILRHKVIPIAYVNRALAVAMVNLSNLIACDELRNYIKGIAIEPMVCGEEDFQLFMDTVYPKLMAGRDNQKDAHPEMDSLQTDILDALAALDEESELSIVELQAASWNAQMVRLANNIMALGIKKGAEEIHLEPRDKDVVVFLRISGALSEESVLSKKLQSLLICRFKVLSKLDIVEQHLPQEGHILINLDERSIDLHVSTIPMKYGEKVVLRIITSG